MESCSTVTSRSSLQHSRFKFEGIFLYLSSSYGTFLFCRTSSLQANIGFDKKKKQFYSSQSVKKIKRKNINIFITHDRRYEVDRFPALRNQASSLVAKFAMTNDDNDDDDDANSGKRLLIGCEIAALLPTVENGARNHFHLVSLCSDMGTSFDLNVKSDSFALASEVIWVLFLRVKTVAKYLC